jgi:putative DNA primase/helicase
MSADRGIAFLDAEIARRKKRESEEAVPPEFSEDSLALEFTRRHGEDLRYVAPWGKWLRWDGKRWAEDRTIRVFDLAREVCRDAAKEAEEKIARQITTAKTVAAVEKLARSDPKHAILPEQLDADDYLLNTPGGTMNLRTGKLGPHQREDLLTKMTAVTPDDDADDSTWIRFLGDITLGDKAIEDYLQRLFGYSLSGDIRDHVLVFLYGGGANGKSTLIDLVLHVLGDYGKLISTETLMESRGDRHPTDIAALLGVRLAVSSEVEEGQHWAESRLKALTGDATLTGRFMRQDFFEFKRTHKLIVAGNHRPTIRVVDEAMRRRIHLVPFKARLLAQKISVLLDEKDPRWRLIKNLLLPLATLIVVASTHAVLLLLLEPLMSKAWHEAYNWIFIGGIILRAAWLLGALLTGSASLAPLFSTSGRALRRQ